MIIKLTKILQSYQIRFTVKIIYLEPPVVIGVIAHSAPPMLMAGRPFTIKLARRKYHYCCRSIRSNLPDMIPFSITRSLCIIRSWRTELILLKIRLQFVVLEIHFIHFSKFTWNHKKSCLHI